MAPQTLTEYERRRLGNIRRNGEMMASLMLHQKASSLLHARPSRFKPQFKKPKPLSSPIAIRRSLRTQGLPPSPSPSPSSSLSSDQSPSTRPCKQSSLGIKMGSKVDAGGFDPRESMRLRSENVARVSPKRILSLRFLPFGEQVVISVGDKGRISKGPDGVYVYRPHSGPVSGISVHPFATTKALNNLRMIRIKELERAKEGISGSPCTVIYCITQFMGLEEQIGQANTIGSNFSNNLYYHYTAMGGGLTSKTSRRSPGLPDFPIKACHYIYRGYFKHDHKCRYFHGQPFQDGYLQVFSQNLNETANEEHGFSAGSLDQLEMEIAELLKSRRGQPVSIASLPMLYFEKYGRNIQADGYLTESQRHGKAGFSLTKLLACLKNSIRLIDRPHGQHSVILAEDAAKFVCYRLDRNDSGAIVSSSHQIYLTFPAESTFNEEDVANYFKQ
ncbi:hypothetical protein J5N97_008752 [Dioscorea zingiberensis]|uniref:HTH OST-type domain-containing protein n=1 Tax=Dioscorea zingiberensis TaxID=325984 RepID=A0A9D5CWW8_9LILI|nr:hypothetical protein J5N97_008752 [Dioscorea zingiberensis]